MSDLAFSWVTLQRSRRARRLADVGLLLTALSASAACAAAFMAPTIGRGAAAAGAVAVLIGVAFLRSRSRPTFQLRVTPEADILTRRDPDAEARSMQVLFVAPWLIVLADGRRVLPVWPDVLGQAEFRHLTVASLWRRPTAQA